jgi:hypothetical protein
MSPAIPNLSNSIDHLNLASAEQPIAITYQSHNQPITKTSGSSPSTTPPLVSPSLLVPLHEGYYATSSTTGLQSPIGYRNTASQYDQVLEKLEHANLEDEQMLSSFKRKPVGWDAADK